MFKVLAALWMFLAGFSFYNGPTSMVFFLVGGVVGVVVVAADADVFSLMPLCAAALHVLCCVVANSC